MCIRDSDWGDGSKDEQVKPYLPTGCPLNSTPTLREHTYAMPGTYDVRLKTTDYALGKSLADIVPYHRLDVVVP